MVHKVHPIYEIDLSSDLVNTHCNEREALNFFVLGSGSQYAPTQTGGSSIQTPIVTVLDTTLTVAQMPSHSHGGSTGIEDLGTIYYDIYSTPCSASKCRYH